jgi:hypothetical protein
MDPDRLAARETPREVQREVTRYGGLNPYGKPAWRVVLAQNVLEQSFGTMRHMPRVSAEADIADIEPERYESGEFWTPRYMTPGWILERWFPAHAWGSQDEWEQTTSEDGITKLKGGFPRNGDYFMVGDGPFGELPPVDYWKREIAKLLREEAEQPGDAAALMSRHLYMERVAEQARRDAYVAEVNHLHRAVTDPLLTTVSRTAQRVRNELADDLGWGHFAAG